MVNPTYIMSSTVDKIVEIFPFPTILSIIGKSKYKTITEVHLKLNANSASVQSNLGDGQLGLIFLTVPPAVYNTLSATAFIPPVNSGAIAFITSGAAAAFIASERPSFTDTTALFIQYDSTDKSLKQIIIGAIEKRFVRSLQTKYVGYLNVSTRNIP